MLEMKMSFWGKQLKNKSTLFCDSCNKKRALKALEINKIMEDKANKDEILKCVTCDKEF